MKKGCAIMMNFIDERETFEIPFEEINYGEVFEIKNKKTFYLRIEGENCKDDGRCTVNAIDLLSGQLVYFKNDEGVQIVNTTLVIKK